MNLDPIVRQLWLFRDQGKTMFVSSSFQTYSIVLLHIISKFDRTIPIFFINTGYHFPETLVHKKYVTGFLGLSVTDVYPFVSKHLQRDEFGNLLFTYDPDYCCFLNKIQPMEHIIDDYDVWISGVRAGQSKQRAELTEMENTTSKAVRYHPLLNWTNTDMENYIKKYRLPLHPLEHKGYKSIGCEPCTRPDNKHTRQGRWFGLRKNECGLNTELVRAQSGVTVRNL